MPEMQSFLPHPDLLSYDEIATLVARFIDHGIRKIRLTGGEPLVRRDIAVLINALGQHVKSGALEELTMTTNGSRLEQFAPILASAGMKRINVSLDTLDPDQFKTISRGGGPRHGIERHSRGQSQWPRHQNQHGCPKGRK